MPGPGLRFKSTYRSSHEQRGVAMNAASLACIAVALFKCRGDGGASNKKKMAEYESMDEVIDFDILEGDEQIMAAQLQNILISLCDGPVARILHQNED